MICPHCHSANSIVKDSRERGAMVRRRRQCPGCTKRWATVEVIEQDLQKTNGRPDKLPDVHPAVQMLFQEKARLSLTYDELARRSRVSKRSMIDWHQNRRIPRVDYLDQVLLALGYELVARKRKGH